MDGEDIRYLSEVESRHARLDAFKARHESRLPIIQDMPVEVTMNGLNPPIYRSAAEPPDIMAPPMGSVVHCPKAYVHTRHDWMMQLGEQPVAGPYTCNGVLPTMKDYFVTVLLKDDPREDLVHPFTD